MVCFSNTNRKGVQDTVQEGWFQIRRRWIMGSTRLIAFIGLLALCLAPCSVCSQGAELGVAKDWKDIYVLPTNPNPQNNIGVTLTADKTVAKPGDDLTLTFSADRECYLTLMDLGTSGRIVRL